MRNKPIKHLGQNFLTSKKIIEDIIRAADLSPDDVVLEAGPGKGILTEAILEKIPRGKLIAVEKDKRLVEYLNKKFAAVYSNLGIIYGDILKFDSGRLKANEAKSYKIVANIPYYITSRFLRKFLESDYQPSRMVLMLQKEVAERIACPERSQNGCKESILSISVKAYGEPKIIKKVPAEFFSPKPKVDSAILLINNISKDFFTKNKLDEKKFFELVRLGFSHKRKLLKSNLKNVSHLVANIEEVFDKCKIPQNARAEDLKSEDWKCFSKGLHFFEHLV
ncbi:ribosomal RNA small subunit methyltransferase A [Patescibacteria group bacterium]|nr:ribosomal RNA small subunit methyltransferase A [Patescibacteria group bacterium]MBU4353088.1 ribosomal RNA small subunit methyltransferase A [Patescibacteria group bacterium]MBU4477414.1 ribosomal RNA small subunit methyltransferase A [Patescibacteria group bacterium]MCG2699423.1 16S rRNA (adenine(1518)-N(6)/adenine(1519)-N(6))-dimethyltransferase RsmA [Candidatus Parcubacteria bacterium]